MRTNERGNSGTSAGNASFKAGGGVAAFCTGQTSTPPCSTISAGLAHGLRSGAQTK
jgi:hypothetical protein